MILSLADRLVGLWLAAQSDGRKLQLSNEDLPPDLDSAEAALFGLVARVGRPVVAWKLGASTHASRKAQGFGRAWSAPFFAEEVLASPARIAIAEGDSVGVEGELVFRLGEDIRPGDRPLLPEEIRRRVAGVRAGIEVPASRHPSLGAYGAPALVADRGAAGWLVTGEETSDWTPESLLAQPACIRVGGEQVACGSGADLIGGPFAALCDHVGRLRARGITQPAGTLIAIGSLTGFHHVPVGASVTAEFPGVGRALLAFGRA